MWWFHCLTSNPHRCKRSQVRDCFVVHHPTHFFRKRNTPLFPNTKLAWPDTDTEIPANENFFRIKNKTTETFYVVTVTVIRLTGSLIWADEKGQGALDCSDMSLYLYVDKQTNKQMKIQSTNQMKRATGLGGWEAARHKKFPPLPETGRDRKQWNQ